MFDVGTFIASGNVYFRSTVADPRKLEALLEKLIVSKHGVASKVVVRSLAEYRRMTKAMPKGWGSDKKLRYYVLFLRHGIDSKAVLKKFEVNPVMEDISYAPGAVLWRAQIAALTRSKVNRVILKKDLYHEMTIRNANTAAKLLQLMEALAAKP